MFIIGQILHIAQIDILNKLLLVKIYLRMSQPLQISLSVNHITEIVMLQF
jgi:hypothetical protein